MLTSAPLALALLLATTPGITQVVVYPDRAQVTRRLSVACAANVPVHFEALPPAADLTSLRATIDTGSVIGLRSEEVPLTDAFSQARADAEAKLRDLQAKDALQVDALARLQDSTRLANAYEQVAVKAMTTEAAGPPPMNTAAWQSAFDLGLNARLKAAQQRTDIEAARRALAEQMAEVRHQLDQTIAGSQRKQAAAEVLVSCPAGATAHVDLTYRVGGAGWSPAYEARPNTDASAVDLSTFATVTQSTGESWSHVRLILSTAVPRTEATPPELQPLKIEAEERAPERKVLVRREEAHEHAEVAAEAVSNPVGSPGPGLAAQSEGLSVQLAVPETADVAGDGTPARLFVAQAHLQATFADRTAPLLQPFVFRVADLTNSAPFPLLAGPVDAFGKSGLLGRYPLERVAQGARFHLTFGVEDDIHIRRVVLEEIQRDTGLFNGNHRFRYGYRYELESYSATPRTVELMEGYPVSELDDVHVEIDPASTAGFENHADDGRIVWKVPLAPHQSATRELHFHVDVPSSYEMAGL